MERPPETDILARSDRPSTRQLELGSSVVRIVQIPGDREAMLTAVGCDVYDGVVSNWAKHEKAFDEIYGPKKSQSEHPS